MENAIRPRRLFVTGGSRLSPNAAHLWRELGRLLAKDDGLVVITGGLKNRVDDPTSATADRTVVEGMLAVLHERRLTPDKHIETFLPDPQHDRTDQDRFKEGLIRVLDKRNPQSRRFSMVQSADVVISLEGEQGTQSVLDLALAIERPVLPLPFGGGASQSLWTGQRKNIINWFRLTPKEVEEFEQCQLAKLDALAVQALAGRVHECLMRGFSQSCFVIMRFQDNDNIDPVFDRAIVPALAAHGFHAWRTDRDVPTGDVVAAIHDGISHCYFAIADTTGDRPNVMYELGLAHANNKQVILLRRANADGSLPQPPFDFQNHSILKYTDDLDDLRGRLDAAIGAMSAKLQAGETL